MEKKEAVREYCIEKALEIKTKALESPKKFNAEDVIKTAKQLEQYITK